MVLGQAEGQRKDTVTYWMMDDVCIVGGEAQQEVGYW